jgi:POT family proton-dependent oligopeptide transporter
MLCGLLIYLFGRRYLPNDLTRSRDAHRVAGVATDGEVDTPGMMKRFVILGAVAASVVVFRGAYEQTGNTIPLWIDQSVDRGLAGGALMPLTWFQSINPLLVFVLTPLLVAHWVRLGRAGREPSALTKMASGAAMVALAYAVLAAVAAFSAQTGTQPGWIWPMSFFALLTLGELYVLPVGLGLFSRLAPASMAATLIAFWYCTSFGGNLLAGVAGSFWSSLAPASFFALMACLAALACLALYMLRRPAGELESQVHLRAPLAPSQHPV